jgi:hypothetical protein
VEISGEYRLINDRYASLRHRRINVTTAEAEQGPHTMSFPALHVDRPEPAGAQNMKFHALRFVGLFTHR